MNLPPEESEPTAAQSTEAPPEAPASELEEPAEEDVPEPNYAPFEAVGEAVEPFVPEAVEPEEPKEPGPETLQERILAVLFLPTYAFRHHSAAWGWAKPWLLVAAIGILVGGFTLMRVDMTAILQEQFDRSLDQMPPAQREAMEQPATKEMVEKGFRMQAFFMKVGQVAGPPFLGLVGILFWGGLVFVLTRVVRGPKTPADLMRCISLMAWVFLVDGLGYLAKGVGVLFGTAMPQTGAGGLVDPVAHPVWATALSRVDPMLLFFYGLLAVGLIHSLKVPRKRAVAACVGIYALVSLLTVGMVGVGVAMQGMGAGMGAK